MNARARIGSQEQQFVTRMRASDEELCSQCASVDREHYHNLLAASLQIATTNQPSNRLLHVNQMTFGEQDDQL